MTNQSQNQTAHHVVLSLRVTGGFLAGAEMEFADGLNCLIGGRGAGKTTALEFLRFGLGLMPDSKGEFAAVSGALVGTVDEFVRWCRCRASTTRRLRLQP
jgi:hypothetical protein